MSSAGKRIGPSAPDGNRGGLAEEPTPMDKTPGDKREAAWNKAIEQLMQALDRHLRPDENAHGHGRDQGGRSGGN